MKPGTWSAVAAALVVSGIWLAWPENEAPVGGAMHGAGATPAAGPGAAPEWPPSWPDAGPADAPAIERPKPAAVSMAETRLHGDPEAPPIARDQPPRERPTQAELDDPKAYGAYEARQTARLYAAYIAAVDQELPRLREDIARGRAMGIAPDEIAKAEDKARGMEAMRAQLLKDHPELGR